LWEARSTPTLVYLKDVSGEKRQEDNDEGEHQTNILNSEKVFKNRYIFGSNFLSPYDTYAYVVYIVPTYI
jgi:hypothetical protein